MSVELPKTESSAAPVPVIAPLRKILDAWKSKAEATEGCWVFQAGFTRKKDHPSDLLDMAKMTPMSPNNILREVIPQWRGLRLSGTAITHSAVGWRRTFER
jgi:hypothetical protein